VAACVLTIASLLGFGNAWTFAINLVAAALIFFLLMRFGFLALAVSFFTAIGLFSRFPITCETSAWYAGYGFAALAIFAVNVLYAFRYSLGGRPLITAPQLDEYSGLHCSFKIEVPFEEAGSLGKKTTIIKGIGEKITAQTATRTHPCFWPKRSQPLRSLFLCQ
jgi:hypothetical protein